MEHNRMVFGITVASLVAAVIAIAAIVAGVAVSTVSADHLKERLVVECIRGGGTFTSNLECVR